jgi:hypothetical protein
VTTYQNTVVDQGQYVAQQYYQPGDTRYGLRWVPGGYSTTANGYAAYRRGGLGWVPYTSPGNTFAQMAYVPNPVQVAVPQTSLMPQVQQVQIPVQVTRLENEVVQQQVPVNTTRMEAVQEVRRVPYSVQRPVTQRIERKVPVDKTEWVEQEMVRPKTVQRTSYKLETLEREVPVQYYETEAISTTVKVPRRVATYEPYTVRKLVPRTVESPVILSYNDPYSVPLSMGQTSWMPVIESSSSSTDCPPASTESVIYGAPREVGPADEADTPPTLPQQSLRKYETVAPEDDETGAASSGSSANGDAGSPQGAVSPSDKELQLNSADGQ